MREALSEFNIPTWGDQVGYFLKNKKRSFLLLPPLLPVVALTYTELGLPLAWLSVALASLAWLGARSYPYIENRKEPAIDALNHAEPAKAMLIHAKLAKAGRRLRNRKERDRKGGSLVNQVGAR